MRGEACAVCPGIVAWTGREMIGWGGGCCGDAFWDGAVYNRVTNTQRKLARSPLAPAQQPIGAWTGRELVLLVSGMSPASGEPWPAQLARAAAYNPVTDTWRRIVPLPAERPTADAVRDGREVLIVGGTGTPNARTGVRSPARVGFAYNPGTNRWRRLAPMKAERAGAAARWTVKQVLIWGMRGRGRRSRGARPVCPECWERERTTKNAPSRWRLRPAARLTFAEASASRGAINLRRSVLGASATLWTARSPVKHWVDEIRRNLRQVVAVFLWHVRGGSSIFVAFARLGSSG